METISMSHKEVDQIAIFEQLTKGTMKQKHAASSLHLSIRQIKRKLKVYRAAGAASLVHGLVGKAGNAALAAEIKAEALKLIKVHYCDFAPTFAAEKLDELHNLTINPETLRLWMVDAGLWTVGIRRSVHRAWRERRACYGELVQLDGSDHDWFEERGERCTLLAFIDDATSTVMHLEFVKSEATLPIMAATWHYLDRHGKPVELYVDRGKVFKVGNHNENNDKLTQYARALGELVIQLTFARSPEAKGRVERLFGTLQDRLVKELRLAGIQTIEEANAFLPSYIEKFNKKFAVAAADPQDLHQPVGVANLATIFCLKEERVLQNDFTIRHNNHWYQLEKKQKTLLFPKNTITVSTFLTGETKLFIRKTKLNFHPIPKPEKRLIVQEKGEPIAVPKPPTKPAVNHPWRQYQLSQKVTF